MGKNIEPFLATLFCPTKNVTATTPPPSASAIYLSTRRKEGPLTCGATRVQALAEHLDARGQKAVLLLDLPSEQVEALLEVALEGVWLARLPRLPRLPRVLGDEARGRRRQPLAALAQHAPDLGHDLLVAVRQAGDLLPVDLGAGVVALDVHQLHLQLVDVLDLLQHLALELAQLILYQLRPKHRAKFQK